MKKRQRCKLQLHRETLKNLEAEEMSAVAGAAFCTSERCTNNCTGANCTIGKSECFCPLTDTGFFC